MKTKPNDPIDWSQFISPLTSLDGHVFAGTCPGLSKREWFAGLALQGILAANLYDQIKVFEVAFAVKVADELIAELNKKVKDE